MSPNIHNITSKQVLKYMLAEGFEISHQKGSHVQLKKGSTRITIPDHGNKILNIKTILSILKQAGVDKNDFLK
ncbi:type II toxin-antitoxin system HicA family toxin [Candidatus Gracilibacteria bacterium]|nr:type II toxin-antitoxin system HicA family toxin [Candidatus Gracilibacteria bacterium]